METIKTIIVDDEPRIRRGIERQIKAGGEEWEVVGSFSDGKEAYEAVQEENIYFDFLITDVRMPEMDGLTLIRNLNRSHSFLSMVISGYDDFEYLQTAMKEGSVNYILKPIDRSQFRKQLAEAKEKIYQKKKEKQQWQEAHEKARQLIYAKQIQLLSEFTWNEKEDLPLLEWKALFSEGIYKLVYIGIDQVASVINKLKPEDWETWYAHMETVYRQIHKEELEDQQIKSWWWRTSKLNFWLLVYKKEEGGSLDEETDATVQHLKNKIQQSTPFTVSAAVGHDFENLNQLPQVRNQLNALMQSRIVHGGNRIFYAEHETGTSIPLKGVSPAVYKYVQQIIATMEKESNDETTRILSLFFKELETLESPALMEEAVNFLCIRIIDRWMEFEGFTEASRLLTEGLQLTKDAGNFIQLKDSIKRWVLKVKEGIISLKALDADPVQRAKEWINDHLGEAITIKKVAEHVYMSPTYFSNFFKAQTGETVLDYVTRCRLGKARDLLKSTDLKVYDIAEKLGYQDTKYFSRLFKEWQGQSPSQYRETWQKFYSE